MLAVVAFSTALATYHAALPEATFLGAIPGTTMALWIMLWRKGETPAIVATGIGTVLGAILGVTVISQLLFGITVFDMQQYRWGWYSLRSIASGMAIDAFAGGVAGSMLAHSGKDKAD